MKAKITIALFVAATIGFLVKLPRVLHHHDKQLHALFYLSAATLFCILYPKKWMIVIIGLFCFGIGIECLQEFSNTLICSRVHGNFDVQDVKYNTIGLIIGTMLFHTYKSIKNDIYA